MSIESRLLAATSQPYYASRMKAAIIAVGSELLGGDRLDTNSLVIARALERFGVELVRKSVAPDDRAAIAEELRHSLRFADACFISGGLGPTEDDVTKEAVADALGVTLVRDESIVAKLRERFANRGLEMPETNIRQAMVFAGHTVVANRRGTAPGAYIRLTIDDGEKHVWIFPGVPNELQGMVENEVTPWLMSTQQESRFRRVLRVCGLPESTLDQMLQPFYRRHDGEPVGIFASKGELQIHLRASGDAAAASRYLDQMEQEVRSIIGDCIYGVGEETLEGVVGQMLTARGETLSTAESCTGGLLSARITDVSGSSRYFIGGVVSYARDAKLFLLGVDPAIIDEHGEVSEEVARQLARGARRRFGSTYGIGITGIAGPTGGTPEKPVGLVHIAVATPAGIEHRRNRFPGDRELIRQLSTLTALDMLRGAITSRH